MVVVGEVVLVGLVVLLVLPVQGFATVAVVPAGCDGVAAELVVLVEVLGELEVVALPMLVLVDGVQGATVVVVPLVLVPVVPPVTFPALPAVLPGVDEDVPIELGAG